MLLRFELFLLGDGEKKCSEVPDTRESSLRIAVDGGEVRKFIADG